MSRVFGDTKSHQESLATPRVTKSLWRHQEFEDGKIFCQNIIEGALLTDIALSVNKPLPY